MSGEKAVLLCWSVLTLGLQVTNAHAVDRAFRITNNSGGARSDLHLEFTGTGGTSTLAVVVNGPGCAAPTLSNPGTPWDITWAAACVDPGASITVTISSPLPDVAFSSGHWTPGNVALAAGDVQLVTVPGLPWWGMVLLALLLLTAGIISLRKASERPHIAAI